MPEQHRDDTKSSPQCSIKLPGPFFILYNHSQLTLNLSVIKSREKSYQGLWKVLAILILLHRVLAKAIYCLILSTDKYAYDLCHMLSTRISDHKVSCVCHKCRRHRHSICTRRMRMSYLHCTYYIDKSTQYGTNCSFVSCISASTCTVCPSLCHTVMCHPTVDVLRSTPA